MLMTVPLILAKMAQLASTNYQTTIANANQDGKEKLVAMKPTNATPILVKMAQLALTN